MRPGVPELQACDITDVAWTMAAAMLIDHCRFVINAIIRMILTPRGNILLSHVLIRVRNLCVSAVFTSPVTSACAHPHRLGCLGLNEFSYLIPALITNSGLENTCVVGLFNSIISSSCQMLWSLPVQNEFCNTVSLFAWYLGRSEAIQCINSAELSKPSSLLHTVIDLQVCYPSLVCEESSKYRFCLC